ncbi:hypothetical protein [Sphingomonas sp. ERG5]|uniref:hypothetical protein n=1 Tax=Sphingomonas sp. ERG5 TaxID=1381597 RepID=UPI00054BB009|nr:hypothetical protein [Sphingomonas sp. ERG5]
MMVRDCGWFVALIAFFIGRVALAQEAAGEADQMKPSSRIGEVAPSPALCVQVDIAGRKAGHLDCATQKLEAAARAAQKQARAAIEAPVPGAGSADVEVGVSSLPGSRLRMGGNLGNSAYPSRPNRIPPPVRPGGRP